MMNRQNSGNMNPMNNGQQQMRYSGGAPPNIFAPVIDPSSNAAMNGGTPGRAISRQSSGGMGSMMMDYNAGTPYGLNSPMNNFSSGGSVMMTPPLGRPSSVNMGSMNSSGSVVPGMNVGGLNTMGVNNLSMNNMGLGMNNLNNMNMATMHMNGMTPMMQSPGLLAPPGVNGMTPMMMSPAGISPLPSAGGLNMVGGVGLSPYGNAPSGLLPLTASNPLTPNQMFSPMVGNPNFSPHGSNGPLTYVSPAGRPPVPSGDPALELALRQSMVDSAPRWMVDRSYQVAREEAMKKENDEMLEKAIRQSLDETNLHRLRQDEIERSNRVLQQSNDRALEEAIRASLNDYSHEDVKRHRSQDAIEQANEDALQRAIMQSMKDSTSSSQSVKNISSSVGGATVQRTITVTRTFSGNQGASSNIGNAKVPSSRASLGGNVVSNSIGNNTNSQPYRPGPFPPEPPPEIPYYQVQYQQTLQQQGQEIQQQSSQNSDGGYDDEGDQQQGYCDDGNFQHDNKKGRSNQHNNQSPNSRAQMMGMMMRRSADEQDYPQQPYQGYQQQPQNGYQRSQYQPYGQNGLEEVEDDDEYMQPASYGNHSPNFRQQPSSQFISVGAGQSRSGGGIYNNNNDTETIVSSSSSGAGIGRNTAAQVTSLYLNNPDLIEQDMQQRYQRQYQQYLQQQLANAEMANQRLASSSQDAYEQIHQHHGQQSAGRQNQSALKAVFENISDQQQPRQAGPPGNREYPKSHHQPNPDAMEDHSKNISSNLSSNGSAATSGTSAARRLSQAQSFMGNPLLQSRQSAVAQQHHNHNHPSGASVATTKSNSGKAPSSTILQSPNQAAFMEKLRRKSGSYNSANNSIDGSLTNNETSDLVVHPNEVNGDSEGKQLYRSSYTHMPNEYANFHNPKNVEHGHHPEAVANAGASTISPAAPASIKSSSPASFHQLQKPRSFHAPRASFHQFVDDEIDGHPQQSVNGHEVDPALEANQNYHPHGGHHALGIHHEVPHRLTKSELVVDDYDVPIAVDEKHHPHLHQLKATLSQTQMSLSSDSEEEEFFRPKGTSNENGHTSSYGNTSRSQQQASPVVPAFPTQTAPINATGRTMKKTFSAPKMVDHDNHSPASTGTPVYANDGTSRGARPSMYDRNMVESVDLDASNIKVYLQTIFFIL
jgi:hypothetical protein